MQRSAVLRCWYRVGSWWMGRPPREPLFLRLAAWLAFSGITARGAAFAQVSAVGAGGVRLVGGDGSGAGAGVADGDADLDAGEDGGEARGVGGLSRGEDIRTAGGSDGRRTDGPCRSARRGSGPARPPSTGPGSGAAVVCARPRPRPRLLLSGHRSGLFAPFCDAPFPRRQPFPTPPATPDRPPSRRRGGGHRPRWSPR